MGKYEITLSTQDENLLKEMAKKQNKSVSDLLASQFSSMKAREEKEDLQHPNNFKCTYDEALMIKALYKLKGVKTNGWRWFFNQHLAGDPQLEKELKKFLKDSNWADLKGKGTESTKLKAHFNANYSKAKANL